MSIVDDATATMIANFPARTGRPLDEWVALVRASGTAKHGEIMTLLKTEHGMSHGFANFVALTALKPDESASADDLVDAMYAGRRRACGRSTTRPSKPPERSAPTSSLPRRRPTSASAARSSSGRSGRRPGGRLESG